VKQKVESQIPPTSDLRKVVELIEKCQTARYEMFRELQATRWKLLKTWLEVINRKLSTTHGSKSFLATFEVIAEYRLHIIKILDLTLEGLTERG
jgi:hypothetical protein